MPRQYSSLDATRAVMSRWRNYVIGPHSALPILPVQQLLLLRLPWVILLSPGVSIWEHIPLLSSITGGVREAEWRETRPKVLCERPRGCSSLVYISLCFSIFTKLRDFTINRAYIREYFKQGLPSRPALSCLCLSLFPSLSPTSARMQWRIE